MDTNTSNNSQVRGLTWEIWLSNILRVLLLVSGLYQLVYGPHSYGVIVLGTLVLLTVPPLFVKERVRQVPIELEIAVFTIVLVQLVIGEFGGFYDTVPYFDKFVHTLFPTLLAIMGALLVYSFVYTGQLTISPFAAFILIVLVTLGIGAFWEIVEYLSDVILPHFVQDYSPLQGSLTADALHDTMNDLIADTLGAIMGATIGTYLIHRAEKRGSARIESMTEEFTTITARTDRDELSGTYNRVFVARAVAYVIDSLLVGVVYVILTFFAGFLEYVANLTQGNLLTFAFNALDVLVLLIIPLIGLVYFGHFWSKYGQTPGMQVMHLGLQRRDENQGISFWRAGFRGTIGYGLSALLLYAGFIWAYFDTKHEALHDKLFDTRVVPLKKS